MDAITSENIADYVAKRKAGSVEVSTVNRDLATLRRMFHLAQEWGKVEKVLPRVKLLPGEKRRERVLSPEEDPHTWKQPWPWAARKNWTISTR